MGGLVLGFLDVAARKMVDSAGAKGKGKGIASIPENQIDDLSKSISRGMGLSSRRDAGAGRRITPE